MRSTLLTGAIALLSGLFASCTPMNSRSTSASSNAAPMSNSDLENAVKDRLNSDADLRNANLTVDADANKNEVTLSGSVQSQALSNRAVELAKSARADVNVINKLEVKPREATRASYTQDEARQERDRAKSSGESIGDSLDDAWIHTKIVAKLLGDSKTPERKINVDVIDNVVTLRGTVDTAEQKMEAERIAKETDGVKKVVNQLRVSATKSSHSK